MIIEQAFAALPEFLVGAPYLNLEDEGTIVVALAMAILQELNGRNVNNPISLIRSEAHYSRAPTRAADLHLRLSAVEIETPLLRRYGYRPQAYLEGKYIRLDSRGRPVPDKTKARLDILTDLVRLSVLPEETPDSPPLNARYLLHCYTGGPTVSSAHHRWTEQIILAGRQTISIGNLAQEVGQFEARVGTLRDLRLELEVTNFVHQARPMSRDTFLICLTRIDSVLIEMPFSGFGIVDSLIDDSGVVEAFPGALDILQYRVAQRLASGPVVV